MSSTIDEIKENSKALFVLRLVINPSNANRAFLCVGIDLYTNKVT